MDDLDPSVFLMCFLVGSALRALFLGSHVQASLALPSSCLPGTRVAGRSQCTLLFPISLHSWFLFLDTFRHMSILLSNQKVVMNPKLKKTRKELSWTKFSLFINFSRN